MSNSQTSRLKCSSCEKTYSRISHLRRHEATHGTHRLIVCPSCSKGFVRIDVARRHLTTCIPSSSPSTIPLPTSRRGKKPKSCDACSRRKVSCDQASPSCSRCTRAGLPCSYLRVAAATDGTGPDFSWFRSMTDPNVVGTEDAVGRDMLTDELDVYVPGAMQEPFLWGPAAWMMEDANLSLSLSLEHTPISPSPILSARTSEIIAALSSTHAALSPDAPIDAALAETVFTAHNLEHFAWVYRTRVHPYHPLLHPPSFRPELASTPLLLAVFLFGALFSAPLDDALAARAFFRVAEEYVFERPEMRRLVTEGGVEGRCDADTVEVLQAALGILIIQNSRNDEVVRRRIRIERLPRLNAAVRYAGAFQARHRTRLNEYTAETWQDFIQDELLIRLGHYTNLNNNFMVGCFNWPAQAYLGEMTGDLPARHALFEADSAQAFALLAAGESPSCPTLAGCVADMMDASWAGADETWSRVRTSENLVITIISILTAVILSRTNGLFPSSSRALLLACTRWKALWDTSSPAEKTTGFAKHGLEMWRFGVALIRVQQTGDASSEYMSRVALDSFEGVNDFLVRYKDATNF